MMHPLCFGLALVAVAFAGLATPAVANEACVPVPDPNGGHTNHVCVDTEQCSALGFCVDAADPTGSAKGLVQWAKDQIGPCTCDPQPDPGP